LRNPFRWENYIQREKLLVTKNKTFGGTSSIQIRKGKDILASLAKTWVTLLPYHFT